MSIVTYRLEVMMEGEDSPSVVLADQRDFAAFEASELFSEEVDRFHSKVRHWAWTAMRRAEFTKLKLADWEKKCIQVRLTDVSDGEGEQSEDPPRG